MSTTPAILTFEEFERLPDAPGKRELIDGELVEMPPPKIRHTDVQDRIVDSLKAYVRPRGLGQVRAEAGFRLGSSYYLQPDVAFFRDEQYQSGKRDGYLSGAPVLAIVVISYSNTESEIDLKVRKYFEHGGEQVWVFYPKSARVWVHRAGSRQAEWFEHKLEAADLFPGFELNLDEVFA